MVETQEEPTRLKYIIVDYNKSNALWRYLSKMGIVFGPPQPIVDEDGRFRYIIEVFIRDSDLLALRLSMQIRRVSDTHE